MSVMLAFPTTKDSYNAKVCHLAVAIHLYIGDSCVVNQFDDLAASTVGLTSVGEYLGLTWSAFAVIPFIKGSIESLQPKSLYNSAGYGIRGIIVNGPPSISPIDSQSTFGFQQFYFGCTLNAQQATLEVALPCEVTVMAYAGSKKAGEQTFVYHGPKLGKLGMMERAKSGSWAIGLTKVEFSTNASLVATRIDNVKYRVVKNLGARDQASSNFRREASLLTN